MKTSLWHSAHSFTQHVFTGHYVANLYPIFRVQTNLGRVEPFRTVELPHSVSKRKLNLVTIYIICSKKSLGWYPPGAPGTKMWEKTNDKAVLSLTEDWTLFWCPQSSGAWLEASHTQKCLPWWVPQRETSVARLHIRVDVRENRLQKLENCLLFTSRLLHPKASSGCGEDGGWWERLRRLV